MARLFKPGDRVQQKSGGPTMEVLNYALKNEPWVGTYLSDYEVECVWYDQEEGRKTATFHQNSLIKVSLFSHKMRQALDLGNVHFLYHGGS